MWALLPKARFMTEPHTSHLSLRLTEPTFQHTKNSSITAVVIKPGHLSTYHIYISLTIPRNSFFKHKRNVELMDTIALIYCLFSQRTLFYLGTSYIQIILLNCLSFMLIILMPAQGINTRREKGNSPERGLP